MSIPGEIETIVAHEVLKVSDRLTKQLIALFFSQDCVLHQPHRVRGVPPQVQGGHGQGAALLWYRREASSERHQDCRDREMLKLISSEYL